MTVNLFWPNDGRPTARIGTAGFHHEIPSGWTVVHSARPSPELTGAQRPAVEDAFATRAEILGPHPGADIFDSGETREDTNRTSRPVPGEPR
ncbi:hypothetical protein ACF1BE_29755 [Streptomyces sp. NPDC014991]|uniref:hypothetical protein n=1 Tax=Streptomyces sp. NPDC014991 TaxID=3364935 RepID=UPI0036F5CC66